MCMPYTEGLCKKGTDCPFAHSLRELQPGGFKPRLCPSYQQGKCPRGTVCMFAHGAKELPPNFKTVVCQNFKQGFCRKQSICTFAHGDDELKFFQNLMGTTMQPIATIGGSVPGSGLPALTLTEQIARALSGSGNPAPNAKPMFRPLMGGTRPSFAPPARLPGMSSSAPPGQLALPGLPGAPGGPGTPGAPGAVGPPGIPGLRPPVAPCKTAPSAPVKMSAPTPLKATPPMLAKPGPPRIPTHPSVVGGIGTKAVGAPSPPGAFTLGSSNLGSKAVPSMPSIPSKGVSPFPPSKAGSLTASRMMTGALSSNLPSGPGSGPCPNPGSGPSAANSASFSGTLSSNLSTNNIIHGSNLSSGNYVGANPPGSSSMGSSGSLASLSGGAGGLSSGNYIGSSPPIGATGLSSGNYVGTPSLGGSLARSSLGSRSTGGGNLGAGSSGLGSSSTGSGNTGGGNTGSGNAASGEPNTKKMCKQWEMGGCLMGDACPFAHN
mmetsp:Transcript_26920/g.77564  ORF Transcript_26920/g.77564 Transcript_26920/m.77564 type:complete len:491 (-) Transcript_26920:381-1853(-)